LYWRAAERRSLREFQATGSSSRLKTDRPRTATRPDPIRALAKRTERVYRTSSAGTWSCPASVDTGTRALLANGVHCPRYAARSPKVAQADRGYCESRWRADATGERIEKENGVGEQSRDRMMWTVSAAATSTKTSTRT
jgi:hypothetical protein